MDNGHITELQNGGIYIVKNGNLTENSLGKRYLLDTYEDTNTLVDWIEDEYNLSHWKGDKVVLFYKDKAVFDTEKSSITRYGTINGKKFFITLEAYSDEEIKEHQHDDIVCKISADYLDRHH